MDNATKEKAIDDAQKRYAHLVGTVIDDRYEVLKVKGVGGMAVVLKAKDRLKNRIVAIKMLNEKHSNDNASIRRFVNESRAIALLSSEHIVDIYDVAFTGKSKYIVEEFIDGVTLREYMSKNAPLSIEQSLDFTMQILSALRHAHEKGVIHRDIKPQNIMVQKNGRLKVTDFGIAQVSDIKQSSAGVAMGTVYYISPEQASGKTTTFSSDIYSVGIMLYEMTTGRLPFEGDTPLSIAMMQVNTQPIRPRKINPKIPQGVEQIILRAMNKAPEDRFRSAGSMLRACEIVQRDKTVVFEEPKPRAVTAPASRAAGAPEKDAKKEKRIEKPTPRTMFPIILGVTTAFLLVILVAGIILLTSLIHMTSEDNTVLVPIPQLVNQPLTEELRASLESDHILLEVREVNNDVYPAGVIAAQDPASGQTKKIPTRDRFVTVKVDVSLGKSSLILPDYAGQDYRNVRIELENQGIHATIQEQFHTSVVAGYIISTSPAAGTTVQAGDTVTLVVSKGAETAYARMIDVRGQDQAVAKRNLLGANFVVGTITKEFSDTVPEGKVISQSIEPGTLTAQKYTAVNLVVSLGPAAPAAAPAEEPAHP